MPIRCSSAAEPAGVLGGDDVGPGELGPQPRRGVLHVADRRPGQDEDAGPARLARSFCTLVRIAEVTGVRLTTVARVTRPVLEFAPPATDARPRPTGRPSSPPAPPGRPGRARSTGCATRCRPTGCAAGS